MGGSVTEMSNIINCYSRGLSLPQGQYGQLLRVEGYLGDADTDPPVGSVQWSDIFILKDNLGHQVQLPEEQLGGGGDTDEGLATGGNCHAVRRGREYCGGEGSGALAGEKVEGGVTTGEEQVVRTGEDGGYRGGQDEVPDQRSLQGGSLVTGDLVQAAQAGPVEIILYKHVE